MKSAKYRFALVAAMSLGGATIVANAQDAQPTSEQVRIAVQGVCPVTGNQLGSHGQPVKVKVGEEAIYLCCAGCASGKIKPEHWATIHANFAKAQGICPVMGNALPQGAKWTIVQGRIIYVCCPPCLKKIADDPATYVGKVDALYRKSLHKK